MGRASRTLQRILYEAETAVDWARYRWRARRDDGPYHLVGYRGHGTGRMLYVSGRALHGRPVPPAREDDSAWRNLKHTLRRVESDEIPAARVRARFGQHTEETLADDEGYFQFHFQLDTELDPDRFWHSVQLELLDPTDPEGGHPRTTAEVLVPPPAAQFGVISDIDDTVVKTDVTNLLRMLRLVMLTNAHTRLPFDKVAEFYRALQHGEAGPHTNPIFYVSSSPWNFYDLLSEVFEVHGVPAGPLFLKDYGLGRNFLLSTGHEEHKLGAIERILDTHPELPFLLLGDSGQHDPEIYQQAVHSHPGRIRAIYIRDVSPPERAREVHAIAAELRSHDVEMVLVKDTRAAARHAMQFGYIRPEAMREIK